MSLHRVGDDLFATGAIYAPDVTALQTAYAESPFTRLILVNSPGGGLASSLRIAAWVQSLKITTLASGPCMSACSLIFMAGEKRQFATGYEPDATMIGIHGAYDQRSGQLSTTSGPVMLGYYKSRMGSKFDHEVIQQALFGMQDTASFLRIPEISRNSGSEQSPWHCPSGKMQRNQCTRFSGKDALSLGLVTDSQTVAIKLPEALRPGTGFLGQLGAVSASRRNTDSELSASR